MGIEITVPIKEPAAIFLIAIADMPLSFKNKECSNIGLDITPPGSPTNAVGIALVKFSVTMAAIKNVKTTIGGVPAKTTVNAKVYLESDSKFKDAWNALSKSQRNDAVEDQLDEMYEAISDIAKDYDVSVTLYYGSSKIATMDADGDVTSNTL